MKAVVSGGPDYLLTAADYRFLETTLATHRITEIFTNGLPGVPAQIEAWAKARAVPVHRVTANFMHDGPATPEERNTSLVAMARVVIAFPGGSTDDLIVKARKARRPVVESPARQLAQPPDTDTGVASVGPDQKPKLSP